MTQPGVRTDVLIPPATEHDSAVTLPARVGEYVRTGGTAADSIEPAFLKITRPDRFGLG